MTDTCLYAVKDYINIVSLPDGHNGSRFTYDVTDGRDAAWADEAEPWVYGWW